MTKVSRHKGNLSLMPLSPRMLSLWIYVSSWCARIKTQRTY